MKLNKEENELKSFIKEENDQIKYNDLNNPIESCQTEILEKIELDTIIEGLKGEILIEDDRTENINSLSNPAYNINSSAFNIKTNTLSNVQAIRENSNINNNNDYEFLFHSNFNSPSVNKSIRCSITLEELKNDDPLIKRSLISVRDEYLSCEGLDNEFINIEELEANFEKIENKINKSDLYNLNEIIKKRDLYMNFQADDSTPNIGPVSTLEYMVESTFGSDKNKCTIISDHIISLEKNIFRWRSIKGDGNCYYRAVIFSYLEDLILDKNILMLKNIMIEINQKFDENYPNTKNLPSSIRSEISNGVNKLLVMKIFFLIYEIIDQNKTDSVYKAYEILVKSFIFCHKFDSLMILFFRYKIYEFIKDNKNKVYSKDFSVKIGNLLPVEYETEYGDFLYEKFFEEQLLKLDTDAEKIVIYLTPFVLKINLKIIIYEFDQVSNVFIRNFKCGLSDKKDIILLYRKTHYDLVYESKNFEKYANELCLYVNLDENLRVVKNNVIDELRKRDHNRVNENFPSNTDSSLSTSITDLNDSPFPKCLECKNYYMHKSNNLNMCINCLKNELNNQMIVNYLHYINECQIYFHKGNHNKIPKIFNEIFNIRQISFHNKSITINSLGKIAEKSLKDLINEVKVKICVICCKDIKDEDPDLMKYFSNVSNKTYYFKLPCNCVICCIICFKNYFQIVFDKKRLLLDSKTTLFNYSYLGVNCMCGQNFNNQDYKVIYSFLINNKFNDYKNIIESFVLTNISRICVGGCMEDIRYLNKEFRFIKMKDQELTKIYKIKEFKHVICEDCLKFTKNFREYFYIFNSYRKDDFECMLCNSTHKVIKLTKGENDDCNIL